MSHLHHIEDDRGDLVDLVYLCSDSCHRTWCADNGREYQGWNGCHELEYTDWCAWCGVVLPGYEDAEVCQSAYVVVNRFRTDEPEYCDDYRHVSERHIIQAVRP